ncbi:MAG: hypothetical protein ABWX84_05760 [Nocardioides sp.]
MDPRLRAAVDTSLRWYDDVFALHGLRTRRGDGLWSALDAPPRWHSAVKTVDPGVPVGTVLAAMERHEHGSVADSFGDLDLASLGFTLLFTATWLHHPAAGGTRSTLPRSWTRVTEPDLLLEWNRVHDTEQVLVPAVLADDRFRILARRDEGLLTGGVVLHDAVRVAGMSNGWALEGRPLDWGEVVAAAAREFPGRPLTDYAWGADLVGLLAAGFAGLGPQRVWLR